ncbi:MAG: hypothetical protein IT249_08505 [Chitinophagaceae bacterium]|nr:hypothetical protein [Chitinophagaceae bacterium]
MNWYFAMLLSACYISPGKINNSGNINGSIRDVLLPYGYRRIVFQKHSFAEWLRNMKLKADKTVYLYNGLPKKNQTAQFAVLDMPVGKKDLQQCADAVMRLRASYLFENERLNEIVFYDNSRKAYTYTGGQNRQVFESYLEKVFASCGTASLEKQLKKKLIQDITPGDVLIKGGYPGHAVMVMDIAVNDSGEKIYLLAQSYMPAQDIHVLKNNQAALLNPWYAVNGRQIVTPEWIFQSTQLYGW